MSSISLTQAEWPPAVPRDLNLKSNTNARFFCVSGARDFAIRQSYERGRAAPAHGALQ
jgi:hypothetical protein